MKLKELPDEEMFPRGHTACAGCGGAIAVRNLMKILGKDTVVVNPACCLLIFGATYPNIAWKVPFHHVAFENTAACATGMSRALKAKGDKDTLVMGIAGDGGTADIGLQALSGAAERNEDILYVMYDNEAYMNTGIQRSSSTPYGAWTTTTPGKDWKKMRKKSIVEALAAHRIPYAATASISHPEELVRKVKRAQAVKGSRFLHIFASCPTGWKIPSEMAVKIARMAVQTNIFPLYEVEDGLRYTINLKPKRFPVREYFKIQGRFQHLTDQDLDVIQKMVDEDWELLLRKAGEHA